MKIKELVKILNKTPGTHVAKIFIGFELSNTKKEKKELKEFNNFLKFDYECMNLEVISWSKNDDMFNNILTVEVFERQYLKELEKFYDKKRGRLK